MDKCGNPNCKRAINVISYLDIVKPTKEYNYSGKEYNLKFLCDKQHVNTHTVFRTYDIKGQAPGGVSLLQKHLLKEINSLVSPDLYWSDQTNVKNTLEYFINNNEPINK